MDDAVQIVADEGGVKGLLVGIAEDDGVGILDCWNALIAGFGLERERAKVDWEEDGVAMGFVKLVKV